MKNKNFVALEATTNGGEGFGRPLAIAPKRPALSKAELLAVLSNKADALTGMANASDIEVEREGLRYQAHALRQAIGMLKGA
jgi:hypothetical protein